MLKLIDIETDANESWYNRLTARLPARHYDRLGGVNKLRDQLADKIINPEGPSIIALSGIGGIGKSSLADYVVRKALRSGLFQKVAWIAFRPEHEEWLLVKGSAKEQLISLLTHEIAPGASPLSTERQMERLTDRLKSEPHLIVIDNLEEQHETDAIIQCLNGIENPSRFIVTTRAQPSRATCTVINLTELCRGHSIDFAVLSFPDIPSASGGQREPIVCPRPGAIRHHQRDPSDLAGERLWQSVRARA